MSKILVIVESPGKIKKIEQILGSNYIVKASYGHFRDLDKKSLSIDVSNNFKPTYITIPEKMRTVKDLKYFASSASEVILAADEDREGEMIASSLRDVLKLKDPKRIVFHEITKDAIMKSIENPTVINENMVMAQQTRRLLDRLVGYKISPLLWKKMQGQLSAGRVQSVVVKIIKDKEDEISKSISNPYFKTQAMFTLKDSKINSVLSSHNNIFKFEDIEVVKEFLNKFEKNIKCIVKNVSDKESVRKPSPPFITSTLQQDASSKYGFNSKLTMSLAQKLYEAGMITYMRTDSTNLSKQAMNDIEKYVKKTFGDEYSYKRSHVKKSKNAQEAHEAIRPTKIEVDNYDKLGSECKKLYSLIWKRTIASQMSDAKINIQTICIDIEINGKSILPDNTIFTTNLETIIFDGFLIMYNNYESDNEKGKIKIKINDILSFDNIKVSEEYTKPPLRYNEAGLIKYLEKNGIGRPSTYATIMSKIIERNYVEIRNVDGESKDSRVLTITKSSLNKPSKIKEVEKKIVIGKENKKLIVTEMGINVNQFLVENFEPIMNLKFTSNFEKLLDKVAAGKVKWYNVLDEYYQQFNPMVLKLEKELTHIKDLSKHDKLIGVDPESGNEIYSTVAKYGPCLKKKDGDGWKYAPLKKDNITLDEALEIFQYPKTIGKIGASIVTLNKGKYGLYFKMGTKKIGIKDETKELTLDYAKKLFDGEDPYALKTFKLKTKIVYLKQGPFGYYFQVKFNNKSKKDKNISLPSNINPDKVTLASVKESFKEK